MRCDCHIHMVLDGLDWRSAIRRHKEQTDHAQIRETLARYRELGFDYLRDGGDRWGVGAAARQEAAAFGISYRTPLAPLCKAGHYGSFIGRKYESLAQYAEIVSGLRREGADFVKIMISGIMDFDHYGVLSEEGLPPAEIRELIHIAHEEGFAVMAHANGARTVEAAAEAEVDSIEHGAYLDADALSAMAANRTVWVPTLSAIGNLLGKGRFDDSAVRQILDSSMTNLSAFRNLGGFIAPGTDAGAWAVPHGSLTEYELLSQALGADTGIILETGIREIRNRF